ncbi:hypothetical protein [Actinoplanes sp. NBRC 103695]|uniref:hypothetical protein n=1 Tax=Actinoplanes sp. NBRC 103695 TaxID=3032202 RepID=UPI002557C209|nr:hypothetical protein [Actinoplanes sp. NBRC 103695]
MNRTPAAPFTGTTVGRWPRYRIGSLEVAGGLGLLVPRLTVLVAVVAWIRRDDLIEFIGRRPGGTVASGGR